MPQRVLGGLLAAGRTSDVYEFGADAVVKVPRAEVPTDWSAAEAAFSGAIEPLGLPAPRVRSLVDIDGRPSIVFDRIVGPSMWEQMCADPSRAADLAVVLAQLQRQIHSVGIVEGVPCRVLPGAGARRLPRPMASTSPRVQGIG